MKATKAELKRLLAIQKAYQDEFTKHDCEDFCEPLGEGIYECQLCGYSWQDVTVIA